MRSDHTNFPTLSNTWDSFLIGRHHSVLHHYLNSTTQTLCCIFDREKRKKPFSRVETITTDPSTRSLQNVMLQIHSTARPRPPSPRHGQWASALQCHTWDSAALNHRTLDTASSPAKAKQCWLLSWLLSLETQLPVAPCSCTYSRT